MSLSSSQRTAGNQNNKFYKLAPLQYITDINDEADDFMIAFWESCGLHAVQPGENTCQAAK